MAKSYRGLYRPTNPKKYVGNTKQIVYRSLLERRFMRYCDLNQDILFWASEELPVRYYNPLDKKYHRYFPDFVVKTVNNDKYMIEIKPSRQAVKPKTPKRKQNRICVSHLNISKIKRNGQLLKAYCEDNGMKFKIITEKRPRSILGRAAKACLS